MEGFNMLNLTQFTPYLPLHLQYFSVDDTGGTGGAGGNQDPNNDPGGQATDNKGGTGDGTPPEDDKTFTQEDVNNIAAREAKKAQEQLFEELGIEDFENAKQGMEKFREWQDAQKTDAERQAEALSNLEKDHANVSAENNNLKAQISAMKAGVTGESVEDVVALAERLVTDEVDMDSAIQEVIKKYPHFAEAQKPQEDGKPSISTGQHSRQTSTEAEAWLDAFKN